MRYRKINNLFIKNREIIHIGEDDNDCPMDLDYMKPKVLLNMGNGLYKKVTYDQYKIMIKIKNIKFKHCIVQYLDNYDEDDENACDGWYKHPSRCEELDTFAFIRFLITHDFKQMGLNDCYQIDWYGSLHYDFSKVRVTFTNGKEKKMSWRKFLSKYFYEF